MPSVKAKAAKIPTRRESTRTVKKPNRDLPEEPQVVSCECKTKYTLRPSSSFVETPRSPLNVEVSLCGQIFLLPTLTRGKGGNVSTVVTKVVGLYFILIP